VLCHVLRVDLGKSLEVGGGLQRDWGEGTMSRYQIVGRFIDQMYEDMGVMSYSERETKALLGQLNVMLTTTNGGLNVQSPESWSGLKELLIQTSWIPVITGDSPFYEGHVDGYISSLFAGHPVFKAEVPDFPWSLSGLKLSLTQEDAAGIFEEAFQLGLDGKGSDKAAAIALVM